MTGLLVGSERPLAAPRDDRSSREAVADRRREARLEAIALRSTTRLAERRLVIRVPGAFGAARPR
jgi:hypothetical protein